TVARLEDEGCDVAALGDLRDEAQGAYGLTARVPAQPQPAGELDDLLDLEEHEPARAGHLRHRVRVPVDGGAAGELEQAPSHEVDEEQSGARLERQVPDGIEVVVARVVGKDEPGGGVAPPQARGAPPGG